MGEPMTVTDRVREAVARAEASLVGPGDWLTGAQRRSAWIETRDARTNELDVERRASVSPNAVDGTHGATDELTSEAVEVVHRIASDPGRLSRRWAESMIDALGDARYVELVGVTATAAAVDMFRNACGDLEVDPGDPVSGEPGRVRPDDVGDVGAWVHQTIEVANANVSRSLSLVPATNLSWVRLVDALYSRGAGFGDLHWERALSRPQVEMIAARTTAELECFY